MFQSKTCMGVDAAGKDIKVVELRKSGGMYEVVQAARVAVNGSDVSTALWHYLLETQTEPHRVVCALPAHACSIKFAKVPRAKPAELARMVRFEAESQIPLPLNEITWDFAVDGETPDEMCRVVMAGARRKLVEETIAAMEAARIELAAITVSSLAGVKSVVSASNLEGEPALVIDIGAEWTDLSVVEEGRAVASRSIELGGGSLRDAFALDFGVDAEEAERLKSTRGIGLAPAAPAEGASDIPAVERWIENMALEIRRSAISLIAGGAERRPQRAVLIGGSASVPGLCETLAGRTGLQVEIGDPWAGMSLSEVTCHTQRELPAAFAVATGLAMAGLDGADLINLMPHRRAGARVRRRNELAAVSALGVIALILLIALLAGRQSLHAKSAELRDQRAQVKEVRREIRTIAQPNLRTAATAVKQTMAEMERKDTSPIELLRSLSTSLPRSVWLSEFCLESNKSLILKGSSLSNSAIADAVDILTEMGASTSVDLDYSKLVEGKGCPTYEFQITCPLPQKKRSASLPGRARESARTGIVVR
ncbi:MAG TPA: type IV pilus assembly protein PilM [Armatimonadota bacterium]|nr:type IV pilus assembly protein PilM [Armatimonadota bacterium]